MASSSKQSLALVCGLAFIAAAFVYWAALFVRAEHTIYGWDFAGFWKMSAGLVALEKHSLARAILGFGISMHFDYNDLSLLPSAVVQALGGTSRFCYVVANAAFLNVSAALLCLYLFVRAADGTWAGIAFVLLAFLALLAVPLPWAVTLSGMSDVAGLIMAATATDLLSRTPLRSRDIIRWLAVGAAMALCALTKRWYLYLVIGLLAVLVVEMAVDFCVTIRRTRSLTFPSVTELAYGPLLCLVALVAVYFLSYPLPILILHTNYSYTYAAYQTTGTLRSAFATNFDLVVQRFGPAQFALTFFSFVAALFFRATWRRALYFYVPAWIACLDFSRVQIMDDHHTLLLYIAMTVPPLFLAQHLLAQGFPSARTWGWTLLGLAVLIGLLSFRAVFSPAQSSFVQMAFPSERVQPIQRHDLGEIEALMRFVGGKVIEPGQPPVPDVYLLSSSHLFNSTQLASAGFQLNESLPAEDYICTTHDVDHRDGFPDSLVTAKIVLVADPLQTHLDSEQKVLSVPVREFLQGESFAHAFARDPQTFQLDEGVRVYVFERFRPSTPEEIEELRQQIGLPSKGSTL